MDPLRSWKLGLNKGVAEVHRNSGPSKYHAENKKHANSTPGNGMILDLASDIGTSFQSVRILDGSDFVRRWIREKTLSLNPFGIESVEEGKYPLSLSAEAKCPWDSMSRL
ncbi:unnamed protein product [Cylindrotheca closterium]|uniref:Uncharacterized protein n=1 Tax=Cylindrotheca closterium TaxID=2856 RepID=A0AAD2FJI6_9STRA|nr:unnamed protein product [Cylindrotheca closterium]